MLLSTLLYDMFLNALFRKRVSGVGGLGLGFVRDVGCSMHWWVLSRVVGSRSGTMTTLVMLPPEENASKTSFGSATLESLPPTISPWPPSRPSTLRWWIRSKFVAVRLFFRFWYVMDSIIVALYWCFAQTLMVNSELVISNLFCRSEIGYVGDGIWLEWCTLPLNIFTVMCGCVNIGFLLEFICSDRLISYVVVCKIVDFGQD